MGSLYPAKWDINTDISLDYVLNIKSDRFLEERLPIEDVWVDLTQAIKILSNDGRHIAKINRIWTVNSNAYCPIMDFIHQTAQKSTKKSALFKQCLESLIGLALRPRDQETLDNNLVEYLEPEQLSQDLQLSSTNLLAEDDESSSVLMEDHMEDQDQEDVVKEDVAKSTVRSSTRKKSKRASKKKLPEDFLDLQNYAQEPEVVLKSRDYETERDSDYETVKDTEQENVKDEYNESKYEEEDDEEEEGDESYDDINIEDFQCEEEDYVTGGKRKRRESGPFIQCQLCPESFKGDVRLFSHYLIEHPDEPSLHPPRPNVRLLECSQCPQVFEKKSSLKLHCRSKHPDCQIPESKPRHACPLCSKKFTTQAGLYRHCVEHHPDSPHSWPQKPFGKSGLRLFDLHERSELRCGLVECGHTFLHFKGLARHERTHVESFICILCGRPCYSPENLISHSEKEHPTKSEYICRVCGFYCYTDLTLKLHTVQVHMKGTKEYICTMCDDYRTHNYSTYQAHIRLHKDQPKSYICDECGKECNTPTALSTHKRTHQSTETFMYQCNFCPKRFPHVSLLNIHERVHTGEKPYQCKDCGQCFGSQSSLIKHNRNIHTPEDQMPYRCEECGKTFSKARRKVYFGHLKQHSGIRDHICPVCKSAFSSRGYLGNHFKKVHKRKLHEVEEELKIKTDPIQAEHISFTIIA